MHSLSQIVNEMLINRVQKRGFHPREGASEVINDALKAVFVGKEVLLEKRGVGSQNNARLSLAARRGGVQNYSFEILSDIFLPRP